MAGLADFAEITERNAPLGPKTALGIGGTAELLIRPRSLEELASLYRVCTSAQTPFRIFGGGRNILIRVPLVRGVVVHLDAPAFTEFMTKGQVVKSGGGAMLGDLISFAARHGLAGLEALIGITGTVGGAVHGNAGDRHGEIAQFVKRVEVLDENGDLQARDRDELRFGPQESNIDDPVIVGAEFDLEPDDSDDIVKRLRKAWIQRKATQPFSSQAHARLFKDPRGLEAAKLIEQADLAKSKVGGAELSARDANSVIAHPGCTASDVLSLATLVKEGVHDQVGIDLELGLMLW